MNQTLPSLVLLIRDLGFGGAQRQLVTLAKGLHLTHFQITVVSFYGGPLASDLESAGIPHLSIGKKHRWDLLGFIARLARTLRSLKPDFIHSFLAESNLMALLMKPLCGFPKVIWGIRDSESDAHQWGLLGKASFRLNCLLSPFADQIIANSETGRRWYQNHGFPKDDTRFEVIPNGIDTARFIPQPELTPQDTVLGIIGRLNPMKDHPTFIRAAALVHQTHPHVRFQIIGDGPANYLAELQTQAQNLPITFHPACTDPENTYPTLTALISSSAYGEGFSNVLGEALACGTPAIATNVGDAALVLGHTGFLAPPRNPAALAASIRQFLDLPPETRTTLPQRCRQHIEQNFTLPHLHTRTAKAIQASSSPSPVERAAGSPPPKVPRLSEASPKTGAAALPKVVQASCLHSSPILWITTGLGSGGAEMMLTQLIQNLPHHRHTVLSLTSGGKHIPTLQSAGATVLSLDMPAGKPTPRALLRLLKIAWQTRPAVIMGWMYHGCLAAVLVKLFRLGQGRVVWNIRQSLYDLSLEKRGSAMVIKSLSWLAVFAETITYNSQLSARQHEAIGYSRTKTRLIPNGFDLTKWQVERTSKFVLPVVAKPNELGSSFYIGRFGRFTAMKDYPTFLEAAALIVKAQPQAQFILVGTGVDATNSELTTLIAKLGLQAHVHLLGERSDLPTITASLDIAVSSSAFGEGFPNVVGEAMACGVPVVATDIGDTAWVMGDAGTLVPAKDPAKLAEACLHLLNLPEAERRALGEQGRQRITEHFSLASVLQHFDELLQQGTRN